VGIFFFGPKTHKNGTKHSNSPRKIVLESKIGAMAEILEVKIFYPLFFEHFGQLWKAKNFFF